MKWVLGAIAVLALVVAGFSIRHAVARHAPPELTPAQGTFDEAALELSKRRKLAHVMADAAPGSWSRRAQSATAELAYAELTGDYDAYAAADQELREAFRVARSSIDDESVGPLLLKAQLSYELHRLPDALASLRAPEHQAQFFHNQKLLGEITSLRGAVKFQLGDYEEGLSTLRASVDLDGSAGHRQRLAIALAKVGGDDEATRIFDETEREATAPRARAWIALQRAQLDLARGRRAEGRRRLELARALFPGFWQTEEHLAELDAEEGHTARATSAYRALVERTNDPEFMDALANLVADSDPGEARRLLERSNALYEDRLVRLPEASYGHALEHFLRMVPDPTRAVDVAEKNCALRPNGEARTRLAQAYVRAGRLADARTEILKVTSSAWVSAETFATAARVLGALGDPAAAAMEAKARALNPYAMEEIAWLKAS
jgi:tetratricopeptide (TPR) repeat protein